MPPSIPVENHFIPIPLSEIQHNVDQLIDIVDRYDLRANGELLCALENLRKRTATHQLTLAILSDSRESKSSLIHALLNTTLADVSIPPSTVACTHLAYGLEAECAVTLTNSLMARLPLEQLAGFVSEKVPAASVKKVLVRFPNAALKNGLVVIDTPELTGNPEALVSCTASALANADACVFVTRAGEGLKENVIAFLRSVQGKLDKFFFVLEGAVGLNDAEQEKSLELVTHSLERQCGLSKPHVALLSSVAAEWSDAKLGKGFSEACQAELLGFTRINWQSLTSNEVARVAGETLAQADDALYLRETTPLRRAKLRRGIKALHSIQQQLADLALASNAAMHSVAEPPTETTSGKSTQPVGAAPAAADETASITVAEEQAPTPSGTPPSTAVALPETATEPVETNTAAVDAARMSEEERFATQEMSQPIEPEQVSIEAAAQQSVQARAQASSFSPLQAEAVLPIAPTPDAVVLHAQESHFTAAQQTSLLPGLLPGSDGRFFEAATEAHQIHWQPAGEPIYTINVPQKMPAFARESVTSWIAPGAAIPIPTQALHAKLSPDDAAASPQREQALPASAPAPVIARRAVPRIIKPATLLATQPSPVANEASTPSPAREGVVPLHAQTTRPTIPDSGRPLAAMEMPIRRWDNRDDEEEFAHSDAGGMVWRVAGLAAVAAIAWVLFVTIRLHVGQPVAPRPTTAQVAAMAVPPQPGAENTSGAPSIEGAAAQLPETSQPEEAIPRASVKADPQPTVVYRTGQSFPPPPPASHDSRGQSLGEQERSPAATPAPMTIANATSVQSSSAQRPAPAGQHAETAYYAGHPQSDPTLQSALDRWVDSSRSGNIQAQVACYAPFVETYFNSRNVTREQVQNDKELAWRRTAGNERYQITPVSISDQSNGRKTVLLQKDWGTPTPRGTATAGSEIEKLVFAKVEGQWKIVDEQEVKLLKLRREKHHSDIGDRAASPL